MILFVGNLIVPEVPYKDFTPWQLAGLPYFVLLLPLYGLLSWVRMFPAALIAVLAHNVLLLWLVGTLLGWGATASLAAVLVVTGTAAWHGPPSRSALSG